jgi:hypothetical protein
MRFDLIKLLPVYFTVLLFIGACVLQVQADLNDPTLSVYYSFDKEGETVEDGSPSGNDGKVVGNAKWENGVIGKAIALQANVWIDMNGPEFENVPVDGFTLAVWVNHTGAAGSQTLLDAIGSGHESGLFHVEIKPAGLRFFHRDETNTEVFNIGSGPVIETNKWVHFAGTYDSNSGDVKTYIDGEETHASKGNGDLAPEWSVTAGIGQHKNGRWYAGLLDEYYIFGRALSADEINQLKDGGFLAVEPTDKLATTWGSIKSH